MTGMAVQLPRIRCSTSRICCSTSPDSVFTFRRIGRSRSSGLRRPTDQVVFGRQRRSYTLWPYELVKDEVTGKKKTRRARAVLEGGPELDEIAQP